MLETVVGIFNRQQSRSFRSIRAEKKFLHPLGFGLSNLPSIKYGDNQTQFTAHDEDIHFKAIHFVRYKLGRLKSGRKTKQLQRLNFLHQTLRHRIICANIGLVGKCASITNVTKFDYETLFGLGQLALIDAADHYDPWRGHRFSTYAMNVILRRFMREAQNQNKLQIQEETDINTITINAQPQKQDNTSLLVERLKTLINCKKCGLTDLEVDILRLRFSLNDPNGRKSTLREIADTKNLSKERIRQLQNIAMNKLKDALESTI